MKIVTVQEMLAIEKSADAAGLSYDRMMRNAGKGIALWVYRHVCLERGVVGLVGSGNNGGDTVIALTELANRGVRTQAFLVKKRQDDLLIDEYINSGGCVIDISQNQHFDYFQAVFVPGVVILDGVLGTGVKLPIRGQLHDVMGNIHKWVQNRSGAFIIAVDCPSGLDCDTGEVSDVTIKSNVTLCMAAMKQGLLRHPGRAYAGDLLIVDIGIAQLTEHISQQLPEMIDRKLLAANLPDRPEIGHKGTFGTCLVVSGTAAYTGAAYLTGKAAYRAGCGLVHVASLQSVHGSLSGQLIEAVWTELPDIAGAYDPKGIVLLQNGLKKAESLILGPGWGLRKETAAFLLELLPIIPKELPTLFDADGLKLLSRFDHWWELLPNHTILTPHPGEMSVLTGLDISKIQSNRWGIAQEYAQRWGVVLLLKGAVTVIATPAGKLFVNPISNPALATAGSGDVLSGVIGGLLAQGMSCQKAAVAGTWLHTQAGVIAHNKFGSDISVTARDILSFLSEAFLNAKEADF
jgi:ADP-dependent NAD(P)H-hydrate dehydratase / NAD(P)H-hydrate epimerase